jgi:rare lipoprotein A (peptidoglycan hydrolase)
MQRLIFFLIILFIEFSLIFCQSALAESVHYNFSQLGQEEVIYQAFTGDFQVTIPQSQFTYLDIYVFQRAAENIPQDTELISQVYDYYILSPEVSDESVFTISLGYQTDSFRAKHLYQWDFFKENWEFLPSSDDLKSKTISAKIKGRKGLVAAFMNQSQVSKERQINYNNQFNLKLPSTILDEQATTTIESFSVLNYPENKKRTSDIYQFDIKAKEKLDLTKPIELSLRDYSENNLRKAVYYWDNNQNGWVSIPSWVNYYDKTVSAYLHLPFARVALFEETNQWVGEASWYKWKNGHFAASRDFPKGTKLKITNTTKSSKNFGKSVVVTVNDYGPEQGIGRLIDLDKVAFRQIGNLKSGVIPVIIEKIKD